MLKMDLPVPHSTDHPPASLQQTWTVHFLDLIKPGQEFVGSFQIWLYLWMIMDKTVNSLNLIFKSLYLLLSEDCCLDCLFASFLTIQKDIVVRLSYCQHSKNHLWIISSNHQVCCLASAQELIKYILEFQIKNSLHDIFKCFVDFIATCRSFYIDWINQQNGLEIKKLSHIWFKLVSVSLRNHLTGTVRGDLLLIKFKFSLILVFFLYHFSFYFIVCLLLIVIEMIALSYLNLDER